MKYISLLILIGFYGYDCFYSVNKRYTAFHTTVHSEIKKLVHDKMKNIAMLSEDEQENTAFVVCSTNAQTRMRLVAGSEGYLKWYKPRLLLFLDNTDIPYIPKDFVLNFAKFPYFACPGPIHLLYLKALFDFSMILIFLMFVFVVILAFGQANDMASGTQALAAMAGGFLPLVFRKFLFQAHAGPSLDTSNLRWQSLFRDAQENCVPRYNFSDIIVEDADIYNSVSDIEITTRPIEGITNEDNVTNPQSVHEMLLPIKQEETESSEDSEVDLVVVPRPDGNTYDFFVPMFAPFDQTIPHPGKEIDETIV